MGRILMTGRCLQHRTCILNLKSACMRIEGYYVTEKRSLETFNVEDVE